MKSFLSYLGGKSKLVSTIVKKIPAHRCYCEVFAGAAWLLFKKEPSKVEIINDINKDLVNLYRVIQNHLEEFVRYFKWVLVSREEFGRLKKTDSSTITDIQKAVRFYYLARAGYGGKINHHSFTVSQSRPSGLNLLRIEEDLSAAHLRLSRVYIENRHYSKIFERFDDLDTFFYIDPPYYNCENDYGTGIFFQEDFKKIADIMGTIKGKFIMSINDVEEIRELYKDFNISEVKTKYSINKTGNNPVAKELLITNY